MILRNPRRGGTMFFAAIGMLLFVFIYAYAQKTMNKAQETVASNQQFHPEAAIWFYARTMNKILMNEDKFEAVRQAVTNDDWLWYAENYGAMYKEPIGKEVDGTEVEVIKRRGIIRELAGAGPHGELEIVDTTMLNDKTAHVTVKWKDDHGEVRQATVTVVLEKDLWKIKDFAGARAALAGRITQK